MLSLQPDKLLPGTIERVRLGGQAPGASMGIEQGALRVGPEQGVVCVLTMDVGEPRVF